MSGVGMASLCSRQARPAITGSLSYFGGWSGVVCWSRTAGWPSADKVRVGCEVLSDHFPDADGRSRLGKWRRGGARSDEPSCLSPV